MSDNDYTITAWKRTNDWTVWTRSRVWQNFVLSTDSPGDYSNSLAQYDAVYVLDADPDRQYVKFKNESSMNLFLLRYA